MREPQQGVQTKTNELDVLPKPIGRRCRTERISPAHSGHRVLRAGPRRQTRQQVHTNPEVGLESLLFPTQVATLKPLPLRWGRGAGGTEPTTAWALAPKGSPGKHNGKPATSRCARQQGRARTRHGSMLQGPAAARSGANGASDTNQSRVFSGPGKSCLLCAGLKE